MKKKEYYAVFGKNGVKYNEGQFFDSLPQSFSRTDADHLANTLGLSVKTLNNWLTTWIKSLKIQHVAHGQYEKCA